MDLIDTKLSSIRYLYGKDEEEHTYVIYREKNYDKFRKKFNKIKEKIYNQSDLEHTMESKECILKEIIDKIKEKNPQILIGDTFENKQKYEEILANKYKNKD